MAAVLNPQGPSSAQGGRRAASRDHVRRNKAALRESSQRNIANASAKRPAEEPFKMKQFKHVESKVGQALQKWSENDEITPNLDASGKKACRRSNSISGPRRHISVGRANNEPPARGPTGNRGGSAAGLLRASTNSKPGGAQALNKEALAKLDSMNRVGSQAKRLQQNDYCEPAKKASALPPKKPAAAAAPGNRPRPPKANLTGQVDPGVDPIQASLQERVKHGGGVTAVASYGKVPEYLKQRQAEEQQKKAKLEEAKNAPKIPAGTRLVGEEER
jgi:hypothetical protein